MQCLLCKRAARGFGHGDLRFRPQDRRRFPSAWVFCSLRCQTTFHARYGRWLARDPDLREDFVIDASDAERAAMRACLKPFADTVESIGFEKGLGHYSEVEALQVIDAIVTGYTDAMAAEHARTERPPVRGADHGLAAMTDDLPWEA